MRIGQKADRKHKGYIVEGKSLSESEMRIAF